MAHDKTLKSCQSLRDVFTKFWQITNPGIADISMVMNVGIGHHMQQMPGATILLLRMRRTVSRYWSWEVAIPPPPLPHYLENG